MFRTRKQSQKLSSKRSPEITSYYSGMSTLRMHAQVGHEWALQLIISESSEYLQCCLALYLSLYLSSVDVNYSEHVPMLGRASRWLCLDMEPLYQFLKNEGCKYKEKTLVVFGPLCA